MESYMPMYQAIFLCFLYMQITYMVILGDLICKNYYRIYNGNTTQHN